MLEIPRVVDEATVVITDLWGFVVDEGGRAGPDNDAVVAGDAWDGGVPVHAASVVRCETQFVRCERWVRSEDLREPASVRDIQDSCGMGPLSSWSSGTLPAPAPAIAWWPVDAATLTTMAFWPAATFALTLTTSTDEDRGILERLAEIGVAPGVRWEQRDLPDTVITAIGEGMDEALTGLMRAAGSGRGAPIRRARRDTDRDYFDRALAALGTVRLVGLSAGPGSDR